MPVYEVLTTTGTLDAHTRRELAAGITEIHQQETGAPAAFIHVLFPELPADGHAYTANTPAGPAIIRGQVRAGRPPSVRQAIIKRVFDLYVELTRAPAMSVVVAVLDVPAQWAMEGGRILPEPTPQAEQAWLTELESPSF